MTIRPAHRLPIGIGALITIALLLVATTANAEIPSSDQRRGSAEALFEAGRLKKEAGDCEAALEKFLRSQELAPAVGTQLNIADCYTALGRTASAWVYFREAASAALSQGDERRAQFARARADELAPKLCRLQIEVAAPAPGETVTRNGEALLRATWGNAVPVDPGEHVLVASARGRQSWQTRVQVAEPGGVVRLAVPALAPLPPEPKPRPAEAPADEGMPAQALGGWSVLGVGAAGIVVGVLLGVGARVLDDASLDYCPEDPNVCLAEGAELREEARTFEQSAVVAIAAGAAAMGVGLAVALTAPRTDGATTVALVPLVGLDSGGMLLRISW